jgi:hypothetical protein
MFRRCRCTLLSLPFVPMALSTLDTLQRRMEAANLDTLPSTANRRTSKESNEVVTFSVGGDKKADQLQWFSPHSPSPFFISPKHDGVRLISYVPPTTTDTSAKHVSQARSAATRMAGASHSSDVDGSVMTCYSRYGRPIYGLFWIEEELRLLRALCGDAALIVDGELYLHQSLMNAASLPATQTKANHHTRKAPLSALPATNHDGATAVADTNSSAETFKTGFLAVSALVHRLRGPSLQSATVKDILQYVPALPRLCVFDVPSYSPCSNPLADLAASTPAEWPQRAPATLNSGVSGKTQRVVMAELQRVRREVMEGLGIHDVEQLRVVPNTTPFSQRLRAMNFLFQLLETAMASPVLCAHFCPSRTQCGDLTEDPTAGQATKRTRRAKDATAPALTYHGGRFVSRIPYHLVTSLEETQQRVLPTYLRHHFEGAVIRSPVNTYDFKEKRKGTIAALVAPLLRADPTAAAAGHGGRKSALRGHQKGLSRTIRGKRDRTALLLSLGGGGGGEGKMESPTPGGKTLMVRAYSNGPPSVETLSPVDPADVVLSEGERDAVDAVEAGELAVRRARQLPTRSLSAVKILTYQDREYAILRPLLKEPSKNPNTRVLVSIPRTSVSALGYPIKPDVDAEADAKLTDNTDGEHKTARASAAQRKTRKSAKGAASAPPAGSDVVVFYGLQCLAENGLVFNVSMPKLTLTQQRALLNHLLAAGKHSSSSIGGRSKAKKPSSSPLHKAGEKSKGQKMASLTGLYATVKFSTLTEHGLPRFGTVKAIRGGKGWFM